MMKADYQMAQQLQAEEQEQLSIEEKSKLLMELMNKRKKHFVEMRAREKGIKPPIKLNKNAILDSKDGTQVRGGLLGLKVFLKLYGSYLLGFGIAGIIGQTKDIYSGKNMGTDDEDAHKHVQKKLQENMHAIQVGFKIRKEEHLTKVRSLKDDDKVGEQVKCIGFLEETINRFMENSIKKQS
ncbi:hypothetical protein Tco_0813213 [Tanacetum coccineum]